MGLFGVKIGNQNSAGTPSAIPVPVAEGGTGSTTAGGARTNLAVLPSDLTSLTAKTTPVDADLLVIADSAASNVAKKLTWANLKATLKTYFDTLYAAVGSGITNSAGANVVMKSDGTNAVASQITDDGTTVAMPSVAAMAGVFAINGGPGAGGGQFSTSDDGTVQLGGGASTLSLNATTAVSLIGKNAATSIEIHADKAEKTIILTAVNGVELSSAIIKVGALPTSDPGVAGQLWSNLSVVVRSNG